MSAALKACLRNGSPTHLTLFGGPALEHFAQHDQVFPHAGKVFVEVLEAPGAAEADFPSDVETAPQVVVGVLARGPKLQGFEVAGDGQREGFLEAFVTDR